MTPVRPDAVRREDQVAQLGALVAARVEAHPGLMLTRLQLGLPAGEDRAWWDAALARWLRDAGIDFVDVDWVESALPCLLHASFERTWT